MNRIEHTVMLEATQMLLRKLQSRMPCCKTCNFMWTDGVCDKWKAKPPAETLKAGCDEWIDDQIPFS